MHPFRPHLSLVDWRELLNFSRWLLINNLLNFVNSRSTDFIIGRFAGPAGLGTYNVAYEIATLPTTEIVAPINRAVLPGYATMADHLPKLRQGYLDVLSAIVFLAMPAAFGLAAVAEPAIHVLLGEKWLAAIPVIQIIALYGAWTAIDSNSYAVYLTLGKPRIATALATLRAVFLIPCILVLTTYYGIEGAAAALLIVATVVTPIGFVILFRLLEIRLLQFVAAIWRPLLSALAMFAIVGTLGRVPGAENAFADMFASLVSNVALGAASYAFSVTVLWWLSGRPEGIERMAFERARGIVGRFGFSWK
jgi:O-antigen/teichoic acid export membrane protein